MLKHHSREKLINAAIYFAVHTRFCGKIKLIKLRAAIWDNGRGNLERIPYALAIRDEDPHAEVIREAAAEREGIRQANLH